MCNWPLESVSIVLVWTLQLEYFHSIRIIKGRLLCFQSKNGTYFAYTQKSFLKMGWRILTGQHFCRNKNLSFSNLRIFMGTRSSTPPTTLKVTHQCYSQGQAAGVQGIQRRPRPCWVGNSFLYLSCRSTSYSHNRCRESGPLHI